MMSTAIMSSPTTNSMNSASFLASDLLMMSETANSNSSTTTLQEDSTSDYNTSFVDNDNEFDDVLLQEIVGMLDSTISSSSSAADAFVEVPIVPSPAEESLPKQSSTPVIPTITGEFGVPNPLKDLHYSPATTEAAVVVSDSKKETIELDSSRVIEELCSTSSFASTTQDIVVVTGVPHLTTIAPAPTTTVRQVSAAEVSIASTQDCSASVVSESSTNEQDDTSNPKKRKRSSSSAATDDGEDNEPLSEEAKKERNRYHARKSRQKKKTMTDELKASLELLKYENAILKSQLYQIIGERKCQDAINQKRLDSHEKFIEALKKPQNRVIKRDTQRFLQKLRTTLPSNDQKEESTNTRLRVVA